MGLRPAVNSSPFHTIPRDPFVRSLISAPPGWTLLSADYSQVEARLVAWTAAGYPATWDDAQGADAAMLRAFRDGVDIYKQQAGRCSLSPQRR